MRFARFTIFHVFYLAGVCAGGWAGAALGAPFGMVGAIAGGGMGLVIGLLVAAVLDHLSYRALVREIRDSSYEQLWEIVAEQRWNFRQTLALLQLSARDVNVEAALPRILNMLESDSRPERIFGWDALRVVFTNFANRVPTFDPRASTAACRYYVAELRALVPAEEQKCEAGGGGSER